MRTILLTLMVVALIPDSTQSQETTQSETPVGMTPEVAQDLIAVLGDDFGRVTGLPLKLVTDPKGKWAYLPETDGMVSVYDTDSLRCVKRFPMHAVRCLEVAMADGGQKLVSIAIDGNARLWDISETATNPPKQLDELQMLTKPGWLSMSPAANGVRIAFRSDEVLALVDVRDGKFHVRKRLTVEHDFPRGKLPFHYALSPDGRRLVTCETLTTSTKIQGEGRSMNYFDAAFVLWDVTQPEPQRICEVDGKDVSNLVFSLDSKHLYCSDPIFVPESRIKEWLIQDDQLVVGPGLDSSASRPFTSPLIFSSDGRLMARNDNRELSVTANAGSETVSRGTVPVGQRIFSASFVGDDLLVVADKLLQRWDWRDGKYQPRKMPSGHQSTITGLYFDPETASLCSFSQDASFEWDLIDLKANPKVTPRKLPWTSVHKVCSWPGQKGFVLNHQKDKVEYITGIRRSESGTLVEDFSIELTKDSEYANCWCMAAHPTDPVLATGHHNHKIFLWDISRDKPMVLAK